MLEIATGLQEIKKSLSLSFYLFPSPTPIKIYLMVQCTSISLHMCISHMQYFTVLLVLFHSIIVHMQYY